MSEQIRNKGISVLLALGVMVMLLSFAAGYYWSRYTLAEDFLQLCLQEDLSDKVAAAFYAREGDQVEAEEREQAHVHHDSEVSESEGSEVDDTLQEVAVRQEDHATTLHDVSGGSEREGRRLYQAILIGFGEKRSAERYIAKLATSGIEARVVKRTGKNRRGREVTWYQVVTTAMTYDEVTNVIMQLKKNGSP